MTRPSVVVLEPVPDFGLETVHNGLYYADSHLQAVDNLSETAGRWTDYGEALAMHLREYDRGLQLAFYGEVL